MQVTQVTEPKLTTMIGHKGISIYRRPENTIPALEGALQKGFSFETDLQKVKDGFILVHDKYIPGLKEEGKYEGRSSLESHYGNGFYFPEVKKLVTDCTVDELVNKTQYKQDLHEKGLTEHAGEKVKLEVTETPKIATFNELILLLKRYPHLKIFLEIKRVDPYATYNDGLEEEVIGILSDGGVLKNIVFNSGNKSTVRNIRGLNSSVPISLDTDFLPIPDLTHNMDMVKKLRDEIALNFWNPPFFEVDKRLLDDTQKLGVEVATWVQNETKKQELDEIRRLKSLGVRYLFTDQAEEALKIYEE